MKDKKWLVPLLWKGQKGAYRVSARDAEEAIERTTQMMQGLNSPLLGYSLDRSRKVEIDPL